MGPKQETRKALGSVAVLIQSDWMPIRWAGWTTYFLKLLQEGTNHKHYEDFLRDLRDAITARLEDGRW